MVYFISNTTPEQNILNNCVSVIRKNPTGLHNEFNHQAFYALRKLPLLPDPDFVSRQGHIVFMNHLK